MMTDAEFSDAVAACEKSASEIGPLLKEVERLRAVVIEAGICWKCDINTAPPVCKVDGCPVEAINQQTRIEK